MISVFASVYLAVSIVPGDPAHRNSGDGGAPKFYLAAPIYIAQSILVSAVSIAIERLFEAWKNPRNFEPIRNPEPMAPATGRAGFFG
jgi:hypothetical protein